MLPKTTSILIALGLLGLVGAAGPVTAANDCKLPGLHTIESILEDDRVGRPCLEIPTSPACVPYATIGYTDYGTSCTHYIFLYPVEGGGMPEPTSELDPCILWVETNGDPGLQTQGHPADRPLLC